MIKEATDRRRLYRQRTILFIDEVHRWNKAQQSSEPIEVVTLAEATAAEKQKSEKKKTWIFKPQSTKMQVP